MDESHRQSLIMALAPIDARAAAYVAIAENCEMVEEKNPLDTTPCMLLHAFPWDDTPQGYIYWDNMYMLLGLAERKKRKK